jgi:DNA-binding PadR family transcriptional regulator
MKTKLGLAPLEFLLLVIVEAKAGITGRDVAETYKRMIGERLSFGSLYTTLSRLQESGYVTKTEVTADSRDNRLVMYGITSRGKEKIVSARKYFSELANFCIKP